MLRNHLVLVSPRAWAKKEVVSDLSKDTNDLLFTDTKKDIFGEWSVRRSLRRIPLGEASFSSHFSFHPPICKTTTTAIS